MRENIEALKASRVKLLSSLHSLKELGLGRAIGAQDANFILIPVLARGGSVPDSTRLLSKYICACILSSIGLCASLRVFLMFH